MSAAGRFEVRDLQPEEIPEAIGVISRGMRVNPLPVAVYGNDPARRERCYMQLMRGVFNVFSHQQPICAVRNGEVIGVAGVAPAGTCRPTAAQRFRLLPRVMALGPRTAVRVLRRTATWAKHDPDEPHVHLGPLAVEPDLRRQGIGSLIMEEHCRRLDASGEIGYLEADKWENVPFYERFGFEVIGEEPVVRVPNWFMHRAPSTGFGP